MFMMCVCFPQLNTKLVSIVSMVSAVAEGNGDALSPYFKDLLPCILQNVQSPLAAPYLTKLYVQLHKCVFTRKSDQYGKFSWIKYFVYHYGY